jgi:hypothetical protein
VCLLDEAGSFRIRILTRNNCAVPFGDVTPPRLHFLVCSHYIRPDRPCLAGQVPTSKNATLPAPTTDTVGKFYWSPLAQLGVKTPGSVVRALCAPRTGYSTARSAYVDLYISLKTDSAEMRPSWEADRTSAGQEIHHPLQKNSLPCSQKLGIGPPPPPATFRGFLPTGL